MKFKLLAYDLHSDRFNYVYWNRERLQYYCDGEYPRLGRLSKFFLHRFSRPNNITQKQLYQNDLVKLVKVAYNIKLE